MAADIGFFALFSVFFIATAAGTFLLRKKTAASNYILQKCIYFIFILSSISFFSLIYSHIISDFSVASVYENSHSDKPILFKISGTWGNHEGSMLLFIWLLSLYSFLFSIKARADAAEKQTALSFQCIIIALFSAFAFFTSNPFLRIVPAPKNGLGLNPVLQDVALAIHPPLLYLGYTGFSLVISIAIAALIKKDISRNIASELKFWVNISWSFLTIGIALGSWWAYRELGWGGFWFWDPVENSSLLPWLTGAALLHSAIVLEKRQGLKLWVITLSILTFTLCLCGFFLVRSGVLTSVHSFANDPERGIFILIIILLISGFSFFLLALFGEKIKSNNNFAIFSREGMILINNLFLITLTAIVLLATIYPLIMQVIGSEGISVGAPYFNLTFNPIALLIAFMAAAAPLIAWKNDKIKRYHRLGIFAIALLLGAIIISFGENIINHIAIAAAIFLAFYSLRLTIEKKQFALRKLKLSNYGVILSHAGLAVLIMGIAISTGWGESKELAMQQGQKAKFQGFELTLENIEPVEGKNFIARRARFLVEKNGNFYTYLEPETRFFTVEGSKTTEAAIDYGVFSNLYVVIGDEQANRPGSFAVRFYYKPFINLIWLGAVMIGLGGFIGVLKRKK